MKSNRCPPSSSRSLVAPGNYAERGAQPACEILKEINSTLAIRAAKDLTVLAYSHGAMSKIDFGRVSKWGNKYVPYLPAPVDRAAWKENHRRWAHNNAVLWLNTESGKRLRFDERFRLRQMHLTDIKELRALSPQRFEDQIAHLFTRLGYQVEQTPYSNDGGRDAILTKDRKTYLLECKRYGPRGASGRPDLQKFHSAIMTDNADGGFFVTTGCFTKEAIRFAKDAFIELIDADALARLMHESKPAEVDNDSYRSMCVACGATVTHSLRTPRSVKCKDGHEVAPSLDLESVFSKDPFHGRAEYERELTSGLQAPAHVRAPCPPIEGRRFFFQK